jgi:diacylglycerol kinase family enzyme/membrane-associated phospholipid phosphatase
LGIPTTVVGACQLILAGTTHRLDAAYCNKHLMTLLAGIGLEAGTVDKATRELKNQWGVLAYFIAGWEQLGEQEPFTAEITIDGEAYQFQAFAITIANAAPPTSVLAQGMGEVVFDDGLLDVTIITSQTVQQPTIRSRLQAARDLINLYGSALINTKAQLPNLYHFRAEQLTLKTSTPEQIVVDGEMIGDTPLQVRCLPAALSVIAPAKRQPTSVEQVAKFWVRRVFPSVSTLIAALGVGGLVGIPLTFWILQTLATQVLPAQTEVTETRILLQIQQLSTPLLDQLMLIVAKLGSLEVVVPILCVVLGLLGWRRDYWRLVLAIVAYIGAWILNQELRLLLDYARPDIQPPALSDQALAIPSGNLLQGTIVYGTIAYLLAISFPKRAAWFYVGAMLLVGGIGLSRLYLGIQWPFDILAGLSSGTLWLLICILLLRLQDIRQTAKLKNKQVIEP